MNGTCFSGLRIELWPDLRRRLVDLQARRRRHIHKVSAKYIPLYVREFEFRYNNRHNPDIFGAAIAEC
jgi:hypothetical protein